LLQLKVQLPQLRHLRLAHFSASVNQQLAARDPCVSLERGRVRLHLKRRNDCGRLSHSLLLFKFSSYCSMSTTDQIEPIVATDANGQPPSEEVVVDSIGKQLQWMVTAEPYECLAAFFVGRLKALDQHLGKCYTEIRKGKVLPEVVDEESAVKREELLAALAKIIGKTKSGGAKLARQYLTLYADTTAFKILLQKLVQLHKDQQPAVDQQPPAEPAPTPADHPTEPSPRTSTGEEKETTQAEQCQADSTPTENPTADSTTSSAGAADEQPSGTEPLGRSRRARRRGAPKLH